MVLLYAFPAPENTQSNVIPLIVAYLSVQPFYVVVIYQLICRKCSKKKEPVHRVSIDTLSKTTYRISEAEGEPLDDISQTRKVSLPAEVLGLSTDVEPREI
jgi:superfamily I DNA and RNA helicase